MAVNPVTIMKFAERLKTFDREHPKVVPFLKTAGANAVQEGSVVEMKITSPEGREFVTNIRLTADDLITIGMIREMSEPGRKQG